MKLTGIIAAIGTFVVLFVIVALSPFTVVNAGHRGVVTHFGTVEEVVLDEGFHWINPFSSVTEVDVRTAKLQADASAASKDLQTVSATVATNYHLVPSLVNKLYQNVQGDYAVTVVAPAIQDSVKAATSQFTAEELITKRGEVSDTIKELLAIRLQPYAGVDSISIVNFDFSASFNEAIEAKVTAEQNALAAKNLLEQKKYEGEQTIVTAQAEAEAIRIKSQAAESQGGQAYIELQAIQAWDGKLPTYMMGDTVPFINLNK